MMMVETTVFQKHLRFLTAQKTVQKEAEQPFASVNREKLRKVTSEMSEPPMTTSSNIDGEKGKERMNKSDPPKEDIPPF